MHSTMIMFFSPIFFARSFSLPTQNHHCYHSSLPLPRFTTITSCYWHSSSNFFTSRAHVFTPPSHFLHSLITATFITRNGSEIWWGGRGEDNMVKQMTGVATERRHCWFWQRLEGCWRFCQQILQRRAHITFGREKCLFNFLMPVCFKLKFSLFIFFYIFLYYIFRK